MICAVPALPMRKEPSEKSEMISQALYGESIEIISHSGNWLYIRLLFDGYEGWVDKKGVGERVQNESNTKHISKDLFTLTTIANKRVWLAAGSEYYSSSPEHTDNRDILNNICTSANKFLGIPYLWGGRSAFGCDCSGFVQTVFKINGINLPRDAYQQAEYGEAVDFVEMIQPADLVFFSEPSEQISHVGISLGNREIIHSSGLVRIDVLDHQGIYNLSEKRYTHQLRFIKRII